MKMFVNSWFWVLLLCGTLGLAPFSPEPHIWGKFRWIDGGGIGMKPLDWWDFGMHSLPFLLLGRLILKAARGIFQRKTALKP